MPTDLDADVALIHVAGGEPRHTPPPGTLAESPPRRAARGRAEDLIFLSFGLTAARAPAPALLEQLARLAADSFYGTPGSVTAALRQAVAEANDHLLHTNRDLEAPVRLQGRLAAGVLRAQDLYICQCGGGQALLIREGQVTRLASDDAQPLGVGSSPLIRYHHLQVLPSDLVVLTTASPPVWSDATLAGLAGMEAGPALNRLLAATAVDLTGVLFRLAPASPTARVQPGPGREAAPRRPRTEAAAAGMPRPRRQPEARHGRMPAISATAQGASLQTRRAWAAARAGLSRAGASLTAGALALLARMAPGLADPIRPGPVSTRLMAGTAVGVPLVMVLIASLLYLRSGRAELYQEYLGQAQSAVVAAQLKPSPEEAWPDWQAALVWVDMAESYRRTDETRALRAQIQATLDSLNRILRVEYRPTVSGGFGGGARLTALAASSTDLYVLDAERHKIWRAWNTGRGYTIDRDFSCLDGEGSVEGMGLPVGLVSLSEAGALPQAGVVAVDADGTLLYCAPETPRAASQLTPPSTGFGRIQAVDVFGGRLYVLDPVANAVWVYEARGGLFTSHPSLFFAEGVRDLSQAIDLALAQDQLLLLYADGHVESCRRVTETDLGGGVRIRVECESDSRFQDDRPGRGPSDQIPGAQPLQMVYSPPPEPALYFLDALSDSLFVYSMRLVYQGQVVPTAAFDARPSAMTVGPPNDLFLAVGSQVYVAQPGR